MASTCKDVRNTCFDAETLAHMTLRAASHPMAAYLGIHLFSMKRIARMQDADAVIVVRHLRRQLREEWFHLGTCAELSLAHALRHGLTQVLSELVNAVLDNLSRVLNARLLRLLIDICAMTDATHLASLAKQYVVVHPEGRLRAAHDGLFLTSLSQACVAITNAACPDIHSLPFVVAELTRTATMKECTHTVMRSAVAILQHALDSGVSVNIEDQPNTLVRIWYKLRDATTSSSSMLLTEIEVVTFALCASDDMWIDMDAFGIPVGQQPAMLTFVPGYFDIAQTLLPYVALRRDVCNDPTLRVMLTRALHALILTVIRRRHDARDLLDTFVRPTSYCCATSSSDHDSRALELMMLLAEQSGRELDGRSPARCYESYVHAPQVIWPTTSRLDDVLHSFTTRLTTSRRNVMQELITRAQNWPVRAHLARVWTLVHPPQVQYHRSSALTSMVLSPLLASPEDGSICDVAAVIDFIKCFLHDEEASLQGVKALNTMTHDMLSTITEDMRRVIQSCLTFLLTEASSSVRHRFINALRYGCNWTLQAFAIRVLGQDLTSSIYGSTPTSNVLLEMGVIIKQHLTLYAIPSVMYMMDALASRPFVMAFGHQRRRNLRARTRQTRCMGTLYATYVLLWPSIRRALDVNVHSLEWRTFVRSAAIEVIHGCHEKHDSDRREVSGEWMMHLADPDDCACLEGECVEYLSTHLSRRMSSRLRPLSSNLKQFLHPRVMNQVLSRLFNTRPIDVHLYNVHALMEHSVSHGPVRAVLRAVADELHRHQRLRSSIPAYGHVYVVLLSKALFAAVHRTLAACPHATFRMQMQEALLRSCWAELSA